MKKKNWITLSVIAIVIVIAVLILTRSHPETSEEIAKCIGENSELYVQLGCSACKIQEDMFGKYYKHLDKTDCFFDREICVDKGIEKTPTWIIKEEMYEGVQNITTLQELTGC